MNWNKSEHRIKNMYDPSMYIEENIRKDFCKGGYILEGV